YVEIFGVMPAAQVDAVVPSDVPAMELAREAVGRWAASEDPPDTLNELLRIDARMSLADDLLLIADHFSMRSSGGLPVPLLYLEFLELADRMPSNYKVSAFGNRK